MLQIADAILVLLRLSSLVVHCDNGQTGGQTTDIL